MSRIEGAAALGAQALQSKKMFGEIPVLTGMPSKPQRLTDQIDLIKQRAYDEGYKAGFDNGTASGQTEGLRTGLQMAHDKALIDRGIETEKFFTDFEVLRKQFEQSVADWFEKSELALTEVSMDVVRKILATELETNHQAALSICKEVLQHITHAKHARILINPSDYALFESHRDELFKQSRQLKNIEFVEDSHISAGVMVETDAGIVDATVETRLELIKNEFDQAA